MTGSAKEMSGLSFGENMVVQDSLAFRTYATTINGMTVHYELTLQNAQLVLDLTRRAYAAVGQPVSEAASNANEVKHPIEGDDGEVATEN